MGRDHAEVAFALGTGAVVFEIFAVPALLFWPSFVPESAAVGGAFGGLTALSMLRLGYAGRFYPRWKQWCEANPGASVLVRGILGGVLIQAWVGAVLITLHIPAGEQNQYTGATGAIGFVVFAIGYTASVWVFERDWSFFQRTDS
jgi:hypothetical protein